MIAVAVMVFFLVLGNNRLTEAQTSPPSFPSCENQTTRGDWFTADGGFHHIPGQEEPIEGEDDVYYLDNTGGNFLQCLCPFDSNEGIQTVWWNIKDANLTQEEIDGYISSGWFEELGSNWNLLHEPYLAKNSNYTCRQPEPTATPTPTTTPVPTSTPQPTAAPTSTPNDEKQPRCVNLEVNYQEGPAPLTVNFTAHVDNPNGGWKEFKFSFDDTSSGQPREWTTTERTASHRYEKEGKFIATVIARADNGQWYGGDDCMKFITVDNSKVLGVSDQKVLPATGSNIIITLLGLFSAGSLGVYLYRRFKLV